MNCPMPNLFMEYSCYGGVICLFYARLSITIIAIVFGTLLAWKPKKAIEIQIAIYRPFNWKIEPISMEKEIRNTCIMGLAVLVLGVISLVCILLSLN